MKRTSIVGLLAFACLSLIAVSPAHVQNSQQKSVTAARMRLQLDNLAKDINRLPDSGNLKAIYKGLDDQLKELCNTSKVIYGCDDRKNYADAAAIEQKAADSTVIFVRQGHLAPATNGTFSLPGTGAGLCTPDQIADLNRTRAPNDQYPPERFYDEPAPGFCSGFKVGKDIVATAGHCVLSAVDCQSIRLITGFRMDGATTAPNVHISADRIFACKELLGRAQVDNGPDWALIRVDREMTPVPQVTLRNSGTPAAGAAMTVVGYPIGLPVKIAEGANVREVKQHFFTTNTDTYGGNSGSPVFSSDSLAKGDLMVEGILVRGENDFAIQSPCRISKRCEADQCRGEDVTLASEFRTLAGQ